MKKYGRICLAVILSILCISGTGCGKKFDASGYTKAVLDLGTKGKIEQYREFTGASSDEAKEQYNSFVDAEMKEFDSLGISEELLGKYREYVVSLMSNTKYEVKEAKEDKDGSFSVDVVVKPVKVFEGIKDTMTQKVQEYTEQVQQAAMQNQQVPTDEELTEHIGQLLYDTLNASLSDIQYGEAVTQTVHVKETKEKNVWEIPQEEVETLFVSLLDTSGADEIWKSE